MSLSFSLSLFFWHARALNDRHVASLYSLYTLSLFEQQRRLSPPLRALYLSRFEFVCVCVCVEWVRDSLFFLSTTLFKCFRVFVKFLVFVARSRISLARKRKTEKDPADIFRVTHTNLFCYYNVIENIETSVIFLSREHERARDWMR